MTRTYPSKESAISMGVYYATGDSKGTPTLKEEKAYRSGLAMLSPEMAEGFGEKPEPMYVYEIENSKGDMATFGVSKFRDGWDLWLINPETGMMLRT